MKIDFGDLVKFLFFLLVFLYALFFIVGIPFMIYDNLYIIPIAKEKANNICQEQGFDFYESYSRIGLLSKEPVAVICKYVEQYRNIDLNIKGDKR